MDNNEERNENVEELNNSSSYTAVSNVETTPSVVEEPGSSDVIEQPVVSEPTNEMSTPVVEENVGNEVVPTDANIESPVGDVSSEVPASNETEVNSTVINNYDVGNMNTTPSDTIQNDFNVPTSAVEDEGVPINNEPKKKKKKGKAIVIVLILLLLLGFGAYYYFYMMPKTEKTETKKTEVESKYRLSGNGLEAFDLYFMQLENEAKNKVYSPLSIKYALQMLSEGSNGDTKTQIDSVLGKYKTKKYTNNDHMSFANAMFIKNDFKDAVKVSYIDKLKESYGAEVIFDEFASPENINNWVSDKTFKLINNLIDDVSSNNFFLINALAIDMNWNNQIHCATGSMDRVPCVNDMGYSIRYEHEKIDDNDTAAYQDVSYSYSFEDEFYHLNFNGKEGTKAAKVLADFNRYDIIKEVGEDNIRKTVSEEYRKWSKTPEGNNREATDAEVNEIVEQYIKEIKENYGKAQYSSDFLVYEDDNVRSFAKDLKTYEGTTLQYVGIMPKEKDLTEYVKNLKVSDVNNVIKNLKELKIENFTDGVATIIRGEIPLFKFDYELELVEDLNKLGIKDVFDDSKADLTKIVNAKAEHIDKAIHKATIEFSNEGIKAAAASAMGGAGAASGGFEYLYKIPVEKIDITFDKPYMFLIRDKESGEVWFAGTVYEPITK